MSITVLNEPQLPAEISDLLLSRTINCLVPSERPQPPSHITQIWPHCEHRHLVNAVPPGANLSVTTTDVDNYK
ncbi:hypothetical protein RB195_021250 [Necator americanus]